MTVAKYRLLIEQAVAGVLGPKEELALREHLQGCEECRREYDLLTVQARALSPTAGDARELSRLLGAISPTPAPARRRGWISALAFTAASAAIFLALFGLPDRGGIEPGVVWRGAEDAGTEPGFELLMYAAPLDGGALEQKANFPLDAVARVRHDQWVAFAPREASRKFGYFRAVLIPEQGPAVILESGHSLALDPGRYRVVGLEAIRSSDERLKRAAADFDPVTRRLALDAGIQSYGEIVVEP